MTYFCIKIYLLFINYLKEYFYKIDNLFQSSIAFASVAAFNFSA